VAASYVDQLRDSDRTAGMSLLPGHDMAIVARPLSSACGVALSLGRDNIAAGMRYCD
jgi:hypothetical protein